MAWGVSDCFLESVVGRIEVVAGQVDVPDSVSRAGHGRGESAAHRMLDAALDLLLRPVAAAGALPPQGWPSPRARWPTPAAVGGPPAGEPPSLDARRCARAAGSRRPLLRS